MRPEPSTDITAFILAGGKSSRMGTEKAFLELDGQTLLARAMHIAATVAQEVVIVGDASKFSRFGRVVEDVYRDQGPLAGIHAALSGSSNDLNLVLAVDMPFVEIRFLDYMISLARAGATVTVPGAGGRRQPLCAVYRKQFYAVAEPALRVGSNKIDALFDQVETRIISSSELADAGFSEKMFQNLNTPDEGEAAKLRRPTTEDGGIIRVGRS